MPHAEFRYYRIRCNKTNYHVLIPYDISKFWVFHFRNAGPYYGETGVYGDRKGLEALRNACAALAENDNIVVYFPCKRNAMFQIAKDDNWIINDENVAQLDLILMKPGSLKISDWKQIRNRIRRTQEKVWRCDFKCDFKDMHKQERYVFRKPAGKEIFHFDSVFYNIPQYEYPFLAADMEEILRPEREELFREALKEKGYLFGWYFFYTSDRGSLHGGGIETPVNFYDDDIYREVMV